MAGRALGALAAAAAFDWTAASPSRRTYVDAPTVGSARSDRIAGPPRVPDPRLSGVRAYEPQPSETPLLPDWPGLLRRHVPEVRPADDAPVGTTAMSPESFARARDRWFSKRGSRRGSGHDFAPVSGAIAVGLGIASLVSRHAFTEHQPGQAPPASEEELRFPDSSMDEASELEAAGTVKLTRHEETELAKKIEAGRKAQDALDRGTSFDPGMDSAIAEEGRNAKRFFIESNIGLVHFVAGKYWRPLKVAQNAKYAGQATKQTTSLTYDDLVQEGTLGLINALEKFDWRKGHKFSSLAWWHIRMRMQRANQNTGRSIRLPSFMHARINKIVKTRGSLMQYLSREPTIPEIAMATGMKDEDVRFAIEKDSMQTVPEDTLNWAQLRNSGATAVAMREAEMENVRGEIDGLLQELEPIQRQVLIHRFGLDNGEPRTVEKIGDVLGLSTNHVIEIQRTAMRKMRRPQKLWKVKKLTYWLNDMFE